MNKANKILIYLTTQVNDDSFVKSTLNQLRTNYDKEIENGVLDIIVPPRDYYPKFNRSIEDKIFNDTTERVMWRTKQNLDISYLMSYCLFRSDFYLQVSLVKI